MKAQTITWKMALIGLLSIALCFTSGTMASAAIPQMGIKCSVCHDGGMEKPLLPQYQGNQGCVNCHSSNSSSTTYQLDVGKMGPEWIDVPVVYYTGASAPTEHLSGGNFWWVKEGLGGDDAKGHNIFAGEGDDLHTSGAPGNANMCANSCHVDLSLMTFIAGTSQGCTSCHMVGSFSNNGYHHADDSNTVVGSDTGDTDGFFRFLDGHFAATGHGVCGIEDSDWQTNTAPGNHNEYLGFSGTKNAAGSMSALGHTMTGYCSGCHGNFHIESGDAAGGNWIRHPSDAVLPDETPDSEYEAYTQYNPEAPVARPDLSGWMNPSSQVTAGTDMAMCLSCHRAHGSPYPHMLRWDPTETAANGSCATCHTRKQANATGQYHKSNVADCNVCHAHHGAGADYNYDPTGNLKLIQKYVSTPNSGDKDVIFQSRPEDFADGDTTYDGICEVCHTTTSYFKNAGWIDPSSCALHQNEYAGGNCMPCHPHEEGLDPTLDEFLHGDQNPGQNAVCTDCHGHDDGYLSGTYYGTTFSHSTHTEADADDKKGPDVLCGDCHDTNWYPCFSDFQTKTNTTACDACHSPGGRVDGIDDADIGAKPNWAAAVYDAAGDALKAGKETWCAGCHDDDPTTESNESAVIDGVYAPGIAGVSVSDESWYTPASLVSGLNNLIDGNTTTGNTRMTRQTVFNLGDNYRVTDIRVYMKDAPNGISWQVFAGNGSSWTRILGTENALYAWKTGHAGAGWYQAKTDLSVTAQYLRIDYVTPGPCYRNTVFEVQYRRDNLCYGHFDTGHKIECANCHDFTEAHIDGNARTYAASLDNYQTGYRLKIANVVPREIPASGQGVDENDFLLCFDCHDNTAFLDGSRMDLTNFRADGNPINDHFRHLEIPHGSEYFFDSDFDGVADSDMTCTACHNVHGSPTPGMVRHGELINKIPGLNLRYLDINGDPDGYISSGSDSYGAETYYWASGPGTVNKNGICLMCHNDYIRYTRVWSEDVTLPTGFQVISLCPVDLRIIDPDGLIVDKLLNEIIGASYFEGDIDGDGSRDDRILIPNRKNGEYTILVLPESNPDAGDKDVYTLKAMVGDTDEVLAQDAPIGVPGSQDQYTVTLDESGIAPEYATPVSIAPDDGSGEESSDGEDSSGGGDSGNVTTSDGGRSACFVSTIWESVDHP